MREPNTASASPAQERGHHVRQALGGVLAVAVQHDDDVEAVLHRHPVAGLLVAAVPEVAGLADQRERQVRHLLVPETHQVGGVVAVVVADDDLADVGTEVGRDAVEHRRQRGGGVVRHDEDADLLAGEDVRLGRCVLGTGIRPVAEDCGAARRPAPVGAHVDCVHGATSSSGLEAPTRAPPVTGGFHGRMPCPRRGGRRRAPGWGHASPRCRAGRPPGRRGCRPPTPGTGTGRGPPSPPPGPGPRPR